MSWREITSCLGLAVVGAGFFLTNGALILCGFGLLAFPVIGAPPQKKALPKETRTDTYIAWARERYARDEITLEQFESRVELALAGPRSSSRSSDDSLDTTTRSASRTVDAARQSWRRSCGGSFSDADIKAYLDRA